MAVVFLLFVALLLAVVFMGSNRLGAAGGVRHVRYVRRRPAPPDVVIEEIVDRRPRETWEEVVEEDRALLGRDRLQDVELGRPARRPYRREHPG